MIQAGKPGSKEAGQFSRPALCAVARRNNHLPFEFISIFTFFMIISLASWAQDAAPQERPVNLQQLCALIDSADSVVVKEEDGIESFVIFRSNNRNDLTALKNSIIIDVPDTWSHDMCFGNPAIYLYKGGKELGRISNHHGDTIRFSLWDSDAPITDVEKWLTWFDQRQIFSPRKEYEKGLVQAEQNKKDREKWMAAMPQPIRVVWAENVSSFGIKTAPMSSALSKAVAEKGERILLLLEWYGSGAGPWSGYPSYESAAEDLLLEYETTDLIAAINGKPLSSAQKEGSARLFGGWDFGRDRPNDLQTIPDSIIKMLWEHTKTTKDSDKLKRAQRAFAK